MKESCELLDNIDKIHTTVLGLERIKRNLSLENIDPINYCIKLIKADNSFIYKKGKNWYCENKNIRITINGTTYSVITAHIIKK